MDNWLSADSSVDIGSNERIIQAVSDNVYVTLNGQKKVE
jgi:hypothetical protein